MRAYPTKGQEQRATRMLRVHCDIYNACLEERIKAWKMSGVSVTYGMQSAQLSDVRAVDCRAAEFGFSAEQRTVKRVDRAFKAYFDRCKRGDTPGLPRFKGWRRFDTVDHTAGDGSKWHPTEGRWAKAYYQRLDFHHQTARRLVNGYNVIVLEDLNVKNMSKRAKPKPDPDNPGAFLPNGGSAKSGLNRSISDVGWSQFRTILNLKAASAGRRVEFVNPAHTSIRCNVCQATCLRPEQSVVICPEHGPIDADLNGAINILGRGLASSAAA